MGLRISLSPGKEKQTRPGDCKDTKGRVGAFSSSQREELCVLLRHRHRENKVSVCQLSCNAAYAAWWKLRGQ